MKVIVFADDFTGALDTGVQFTQAGLLTEVLLWTDFQKEPVSSGQHNANQLHQSPVQVTVVDTESRHISLKQAYDRLFKLSNLARSRAFTHFYKKTDSTLRGNTGVEMQAMLDTLPYETLHFLPAYPKMGRQTINGHQYVNGIPLHDTEFASDLLNPIHTAYIPDLLIRQGLQNDISVTCLDSPENRHEYKQYFAAAAGHDPANTANCPADRTNTKVKQVLVYSAQETKTLEASSHALAAANELVLTAGCAGFAEFLAQRLKVQFLAADDSAARLTTTAAGQLTSNKTDSQANMTIASKTLLLCGSASQASLSQIRNYVAVHRNVTVHTLSHSEKTPAYWQSLTGQQALEQLLRQLNQVPLYIIQSVQHKRDIDKTLSADTIAAAFGMLVRELLAFDEFVNLIIFGGDTVYGMMNAMGKASLRPISEISPGIVASELLVSTDGFAKSLLLITKAGGLGSPETLTEILAWIDKS